MLNPKSRVRNPQSTWDEVGDVGEAGSFAAVTVTWTLSDSWPKASRTPIFLWNDYPVLRSRESYVIADLRYEGLSPILNMLQLPNVYP